MVATTSTTGVLPILISYSISRLSNVFRSRDILYGREGFNVKAMRSDRLANLLAVVEVLLRNCFLQEDGLICHIEKKWARPICIAEIVLWMAKKCCYKTVSRCLDDLVNLGLIERAQIKRKNKISGLLEVSNSLIRFTPKFWKLLKLEKLFADSVKWSKEHGKRRLLMPFKSISLKATSACKSAGNLAKKVIGELESMSNDTTTRVKYHCNKIINMLHQK